MRSLLSVMVMVVVMVVGGFACAAQAEDSTQSGTASEDFRGPVVLGYFLVFLLIVIYLLASQRKNAHLGDEIDFLKRRVDELNEPRD